MFMSLRPLPGTSASLRGFDRWAMQELLYDKERSWVIPSQLNQRVHHTVSDLIHMFCMDRRK